MARLLAPGVLGTVVGAGTQALHGVFAQACSQPLAQLLPGQRLLRALVEQLAALRGEGRQVTGNQADREHRCRQLQLFEPATGQLEQHGRFALGTEQADNDLAVGVVTMLQIQHEALHTAVTAGQVGGEVGGQAAQREQQRLVGLDLEIQLDARLEQVRRAIERQGQRAAPEQGIELDQHLGGKALGQAIAWQCQQLLQAVHAHAGKGRGRLAGQAEALDRQLAERLLQRDVVGHCQTVMGVGQHACCCRVGRERDAMAKAQCRQLLAQARLEAWPGAEQAEARLHFQEQATRIVQADLGAVAIGPGREELLPVLHVREVVIGHGEVAGQRLGRGERLPRFEAERAGGWVDCLQHAALRRPGEQYQRRLGIGALAQDAVHRQLR